MSGPNIILNNSILIKSYVNCLIFKVNKLMPVWRAALDRAGTTTRVPAAAAAAAKKAAADMMIAVGDVAYLPVSEHGLNPPL